MITPEDASAGISQNEINNLEEGLSSEKDEHTIRSASRILQLPKQEIDNPHHVHEPLNLSIPSWETTFMIVCSVAVFIDPLYGYIPVFNDDLFCYIWDPKLMWTFMGLRSTLDVFYVIDIYHYLRSIRDKRNAKRVRNSFWRKNDDDDDKKMLLSKPDQSLAHILQLIPSLGRNKLLLLLPRIFIALPTPQGAILTGFYTNWFNFYFGLSVTSPIQYALRVYYLYAALKLLLNIETVKGRWLRSMLDFLPFIFASHLFGSLWYFFAIDREQTCWQQYACTVFDCHENEQYYMFYCGSLTEQINMDLNITRLKEACPIDTPDATKFDFGIYLYALQSGMRKSKNLPEKMLQCFWWGLRNLSYFGSNLNTSFFALKITFSLMVSISGLVLFFIYVSARLQVSKKISEQFRIKQKMKMTNTDIDLWLSSNGLPYKELKPVIMKYVHRQLEENKDVDMHNLLSILPLKYKTHIMRLVRMASLKKVPVLANMDEQVLAAMSEHLKLVVYEEDSYIIREGEPLEKMFFITHGIALTYKINGDRRNGSSSSIVECLEKSDFYGDELLNWAFKLTSFSDFPISTKIVKSQTKVEAFILRANDLKNVVSRFWWYFSKEQENSQLERWQHLAASSVQAAWRRKKTRATGAIGWDIFQVK